MSLQTELNINGFKGERISTTSINDRDWIAIADNLEQHGYAVLESLLSSEVCEQVCSWYDDPGRFRRTVHMARYRFGEGSYAYFRQPLPDLISNLQIELYQKLMLIAQSWYYKLRIPFQFPSEYNQFQNLCKQSGQTEPAVLMLDYGTGDHNYLHQDLYGKCIFPIQLNIQLNRPNKDFGGGEFVLTDQHPRRQSKVEVVQLQQGDGTLFATSIHPVKSKLGYYRATLRHGVSRLTWGHRRALGVILHNAPN